MDTPTSIPSHPQNEGQEAQALRRETPVSANNTSSASSSTPSVSPIPVENTPPPSEEKHGLPSILKIFVGFVIVGIIGMVLLSIISKFSPKKATEDITLTYWGLWEPKSIMAPILADFEKQNPHIHVDYRQEDPKQYTDRLLTRIKAGNGPDVFRFHNSWMPMVIQVLAPLPNAVITKKEFQKVFYPVMQADLIQNGALYGIPLNIDTLALFTNTSLFQAAGVQPPASWTDFLTMARTLTVKDDFGRIKTAGAAIGTFDNISHAADLVSVLFIQNGANLTDFSKKQQNATDALSFYTSFANAQNSVWDQTLENSLINFAKGGVGMYFGYSWDIFIIKAINPSLQFSIHAVPHLPGRDITIANYWVEGVSNRSQHQREAFILLHYLSQKDTMQKLYTEEAKVRLFGELYSRVDLAEMLKTNTLIYPFIQQAPHAQSTYFVGETQDTAFNAQMNGYLANAVSAVLGDTSPQSALDTLSKGEAQVLQQYAAKTSSQ